MRQIRKYQKDKGRILDSNKLLYHSMPIGCILALLLLGCSLLNPAGFSNGISNGMNDSLGNMGSSNKAYAAELTSSTNDTSAALIVDDGNIEDVILAESGVNYKSHNIKIKAANVESYTLQISASSNGTSELKLDGGNTTIPGAGGVVGSNMPTNTWGYAWGAENATEDSMTYYTLPAYGSVGTTISTGLLASDTPTNNTIDTSNKLSFAANFSDNIPSGHYTTSVLLSLAIEPKELLKTWDELVYMQDMNPSACSSQTTPAASATTVPTKTLADSRDGNKYTISKLADGNCWMTDNLALPGGTTLTINDSDLDMSVFTDISKTYTLPVATNGGFSSTQVNDKNSTATYPNQQVRNPANPDTKKYGAYYSWCAATAGTCLQGAYVDIIPNSSNAGNAGNVANTTIVPADQNATSSICPKGWQLPTSNNTDAKQKSFSGLTTAYNIGSDADGSEKLRTAPLSFVYAGFATDGSMSPVGVFGRYWSSTANAATNAYNLSFASGNVNPSSYYHRYLGFSVRCVAR